MAVDRQQVEDFLTMIKQAHGEFQAECIPKARKKRLYFVKRNKLKETITFIQRDVPAGTKATPVPAGVAQDRWKKLVDDLAAAEKLIREEQKKVAADVPMPEPTPNPYVDTKSSSKRYSRRQEAMKKLKKLLIDIYGEKKGKLRFKIYEGMAKAAGQPGSPSAMYGFFNGQGEEDVKTRVAEKAAARRGEAPAEGTAAATDATTALAPADAAPAGAAAGATGGIMSTLWPTDKPIYMRPATIIGGVAVLGVVGWMLLSPSKPKPAAKPAEAAK